VEICTVSTVEMYTVLWGEFTYLLKSRNLILLRLSTTGLAYGIIPDEMTKPRTKNGLLASVMSEVREQFFGWQNETL